MINLDNLTLPEAVRKLEASDDPQIQHIAESLVRLLSERNENLNDHIRSMFDAVSGQDLHSEIIQDLDEAAEDLHDKLSTIIRRLERIDKNSVPSLDRLDKLLE